eukprot:TRINITY_DN7653_c1_g2_i1.p1 TRINITY_DN7653_c1_g2~~TRINITY_DN7653_c1_g2_i1.p1  ORF type:complete len:367 (+),score=41.73 TRINITY_DN7653_c1_g2_i1:153-1253(+)
MPCLFPAVSRGKLAQCGAKRKERWQSDRSRALAEMLRTIGEYTQCHPGTATQTALSLRPLGFQPSAGLLRRPLFVRPAEVVQQLEQLVECEAMLPDHRRALRRDLEAERGRAPSTMWSGVWAPAYDEAARAARAAAGCWARRAAEACGFAFESASEPADVLPGPPRPAAEPNRRFLTPGRRAGAKTAAMRRAPPLPPALRASSQELLVSATVATAALQAVGCLWKRWRAKLWGTRTRGGGAARPPPRDADPPRASRPPGAPRLAPMLAQWASVVLAATAAARRAGVRVQKRLDGRRYRALVRGRAAAAAPSGARGRAHAPARRRAPSPPPQPPVPRAPAAAERFVRASPPSTSEAAGRGAPRARKK